jgi:hypothetical protein
MSDNGFNMVIQLDFGNIDGLARDVEKIIFTVISKGARTIAGRAREKVPVDTGALKASIYVSNEKGSSYNFALAGAQKLRTFDTAPNARVGAGKGSIVVGAAAPYAMAVEMGHHTPGGGFYPARPYLIPSVYETVPEIEMELKDEIENYQNRGDDWEP